MNASSSFECLQDEICGWCGKPFETHRTDQKYCSVKCRIQSVETFRRAVISEERRRARQGKTCQQCGATFDATLSDQLYCSNRCNQIAYNYRKRTEPANCRQCGEDFVPKRPDQKFCSLSCASKHRGALPPWYRRRF